MKVTISDVAKKASVSKSTVSRIINGNHEQNTQETVNKVLKVIEELDYKPNALARSLKSTKTNVIGIILSKLQNQFWSSVLEGVEDTCRSYGYNLMICNSNEDGQLEEEHIRSLQMHQLDGLIINPTLKNKLLYKKLSDNKFPFILMNRKLYDQDVHMVTVDNIKGARVAIEHLIQTGRRKIAIFLYPPAEISPRLERLEGYKQALINNGIKVNQSLIQIVGEEAGEVEEAVKRLLNSPDRPDAIFSTNNMMTLSILEGIKSQQIMVPQDLGLIGYDETVWAKHLNPPLTTVNQPSYEMGTIAAKKLIYLIEGKEDQMAEKVVSLEPNLIIRKSCGADKSN
ncbi:LacI family DNA-binding transcriptional regulator [Bacillus infantis]|uniref:LacI family transcriptional regulator n=1 Tax=Bacillus infantis TaxID=324767 RepID=A0A5D4QU69_9BACI|nr:LacI family DNA-binding transcriptional regulator [Bacillus infantis]TYS40782.1 LacI family transcriptional regulator [Bacillus infantis]